MTPATANEVWTLKTAWLCLTLGFVAVWAGLAFASALDVAWFGAESFDLFHRSPAARPISYLVPRVFAFAVCMFLAGVRTPDALLSKFALRKPTAKYVVIAAISGLWIAVFLQSMHPGKFSNLRLQSSLLLGVALLLGPVFEELVMRGFFYTAFRNSFAVPLSVALVFGIDTILFHPAVLRAYVALPGVAIVNVVACVLRERAGNTWPCISFHVGYSAFFALFI